MAVKQPKLSDKEKEDYQALTQLIQDLYVAQGWDKRKIPFPMIASQIKNILAEHKDYKYAGITYTLNYMVNILELNLFTEESNGSILSLVPYYYQEAWDFCIKCAEIKKSVKGFDFTDDIRIVRVSGNRDKKVDEMDFS